jgi:L,D-transpeptidase ErfK/SrfK
MGLGSNSYGIHGSDIPWSVGRLVTHGCIRMYPEDIQQLFHTVSTGTPVTIIYEPVKIGIYSERVFAEIHRDIYEKIEDFSAYGFKQLQQSGLTHRVDLKIFQQALKRQDGMPIDITIPNKQLNPLDY